MFDTQHGDCVSLEIENLFVRTFWAMAGKGKKKRHSKDSGVTSGDGGEQPAQRRGSKSVGKSKKSSKGSKGSKFQGDIFNEAAMENAYYVCHNVQVSWNLFKYRKMFKINIF